MSERAFLAGAQGVARALSSSEYEVTVEDIHHWTERGILTPIMGYLGNRLYVLDVVRGALINYTMEPQPCQYGRPVDGDAE